MPLEIERKFLIKYPDAAALEKLCADAGGETWDIEQTYLAAKTGETRRLRRVVSDGEERFFYTEKRRISAVTRIENEREIDRAEYDSLLAGRDPELSVIRKTRFRIPDGAHVWEVDLFPFWTDRAILEIELAAENERFELPPFVELIREVTKDKRYTNRAMAKTVPED